MQGDGRDAIGGWSQGDLSVTMDRRCSSGTRRGSLQYRN